MYDNAVILIALGLIVSIMLVSVLYLYSHIFCCVANPQMLNIYIYIYTYILFILGLGLNIVVFLTGLWNCSLHHVDQENTRCRKIKGRGVSGNHIYTL